MNRPILQQNLPLPPWIDPSRWRLPGTMPLDMADWLIRDEAFSDQMARRDDLIANHATDVHALLPRARAAAEECFDLVLEALDRDPAYTVAPGRVIRPDGVTVPLDRTTPMLTLGRLIQADLCLMEAGPRGHVLAGAILCFPAHWTLSEKLGRPLDAIHTPVPEYDPDVAKRVQRLFDAIRPEQLLWRANAVLYEDSELFTPKAEAARSHDASLASARFVRSERQVLRKLPKTGAVVFSIHTYMVAIENLHPVARDALPLLVREPRGTEVERPD